MKYSNLWIANGKSHGRKSVATLSVVLSRTSPFGVRGTCPDPKGAIKILKVAAFRPTLAFLIFCFGSGASSTKFVEKGNDAYQKSKYEEAEQYYQKALKNKKFASEINFNLGNTYFQKSDYERAKTFYEISLRSNNNSMNTFSYYSLGNCEFRRNQYEQALQWYKKAMDNDPQDIDAKYNYEVTIEKIKENSKKEDEEKQQQERKKQKEENKQKEMSSSKSDKNENKTSNKDTKSDEKQKVSEESNSKERRDETKAPEKSKTQQPGKSKKNNGTKNQEQEKMSKKKANKDKNDRKLQSAKDAQDQKGFEKNDQAKNKNANGIEKKEALQILNMVHNEKSDLLWNFIRQEKIQEKPETKDW